MDRTVLENLLFVLGATGWKDRSLMEKRATDVLQLVAKDLNADGITAKVLGRQKHLYSVYQKMVIRGRDFNEIYDLVGIDILNSLVFE